MANQTQLQLVIQAKDEASAKLNKVSKEINNLASSKSFGLLKTAAAAATVAVTGVATA